MALHPNAIILAKELSKAGWNKANIAGKLGNFQLESGFNPRVNEGGKVGTPQMEGGYGVAQWTGGRQKNLIDFAKQQKMDPGDIHLQAKFLLYELGGPEKKAAAYVREAVSPEESARRFLTDFERAGIPKTKQRQEAARAIYGQLGFLDQPGQAPVAQGGQKPSSNLSVSEILAPIFGGAANAAAVEQKKSVANTLLEGVKEKIVGDILKNALNPFGGFQ
jgi:hypothetical protein